MGNILGCFGCSDDSRECGNQRSKVIPREHRSVVQITPPRAISTTQNITESPLAKLVSEDAAEEKLSVSARKRVTFDDNVTTYEHVSVSESTESYSEKEKLVDKPSHSSCSTEEGSVISSVGSYPPNHRYQNCRDSDDECEAFGDSDLDEEEYETDDAADDYSDNDEDVEGRMLVHKIWSESVLPESMESRAGNSLARVNSEEVESPLVPRLVEQEKEIAELKGHSRDRSGYVHPALNPVENISQWKALKSKVAQPVNQPLKENLPASEQEISVNASLSNWLVSPETPSSADNKTSFSGFENVSSAKTMSGGSNSVRSFEDRPILGALTVDELKQLSASASPRKSPSRSPDEIPIIGTVGTYWNHSGSVKKVSGSASSFKGIPNTTSKYREDKRVNWHSTPFETRLERALKRGAAEA